MLIKTVQVARNFFTILLSLYNSALLPTQPKLYTGKYARLTTLKKMSMDPCQQQST